VSQPPDQPPGWQPPHQPPGWQPPGQPPGWQPQGQPPGWQPPPAKKPKAPLLLGMLIGAFAPWVLGVAPLVVTNGSNVAGYALWFWPLIPLAGIVLLFPEQTRRWGLGILIGFFGMLIIGAGACIALVVGLGATGGYS
jgi:hypothetical protein